MTTGGIDHLANHKRLMAQLLQDVADHKVSVAEATERSDRYLSYIWVTGMESVLDQADRPRE